MTTSPQDKTNSLSVFISYSHNDTVFLKRLQVHLKQLEREGRVDRWDDTRIKSGQDWKAEIKTALSKAGVAVLLLSADFLASDFIDSDEMPEILAAAEANGLTVLPVIVKPCRFTRDKRISKFQAVNDPSKPLINQTEGEQETVWVSLANRIEELLADPQ